MAKYNLVSSNDWTGLYKNGKLIYEGHSIPSYIFLNEMNKRKDVYGHYIGDSVYADAEWLENEGNLPENLLDVKCVKSE